MSLFDGGGGGPSLSAHADILSVSTPTTSSSLHALIEEIKRRGRTAVSSRDLRGAEALYTKGIDTLLQPTTTAVPGTNMNVNTTTEEEYSNAERMKDRAILRSNRSLVRLQMSYATDALDDARHACTDDPTYSKAYWRLGQAIVATSAGRAASLSEAVTAFDKALALGNNMSSNNKALAKEVAIVKDKLRLATELEAAVAQDEAEEMILSQDLAMTMMKQRKLVGGVVVTPPTMTSCSKSSSVNSTSQQPDGTTTTTTTTVAMEVEGENNDELFTKSDHVRGYKIRSDGKKTSYFHREIDDETKKLIGDIAPKKLGEENTSVTAVDSSSIAAQQQQQEGTSAWNKAGTWEERDVTPWAKDTLSTALLSCKYTLPNGSPSPGSYVIVYEIGKLEGSASYAAVRGKKKYIYEFALTIKWEFTLLEDSALIKQQCRGEMTFPDIDGTVEVGEGYDIVNYSVDGLTCVVGIGPLLERFVRDCGFRDTVHEAIDNWVKLFRATY